MMEKLKQYRWVDDSISIDDFYDNLPEIVKNLIMDIERADAEEHYGYFDWCEALEYISKQFVPPGIITMEQRERLCNRYYGG